MPCFTPGQVRVVETGSARLVGSSEAMRSSRVIRSIAVRVTFWLWAYELWVARAFSCACEKAKTVPMVMSVSPLPASTSMVERPRQRLRRADVDNQPGVLARALEPLAQAGADLRLVMGFRLPHTPERAAIELYPVSGKRATAAAAQAGLAESRDIPCLLVEGDNRPGLGAAMARGLADARININFLVAQVVGRKFTATFGFGDEAAAASATLAIKAAAAPPKKAKPAPRKRR